MQALPEAGEGRGGVTDKQRLDWLERFVLKLDELVLHSGNHVSGHCHPYIGLSIKDRTLRRAIDDCQLAKPTKRRKSGGQR